jgi:hypothetical protein
MRETKIIIALKHLCRAGTRNNAPRAARSLLVIITARTLYHRAGGEEENGVAKIEENEERQSNQWRRNRNQWRKLNQ